MHFIYTNEYYATKVLDWVEIRMDGRYFIHILHYNLMDAQFN